MTSRRQSEPEPIGARLRRLRAERGLSQRDLAEPEFTGAYISRIESGDRRPSVTAIRSFAARLAVSAEYLETGSEFSGPGERELGLINAELQLRLADDPAAAEKTLTRVLEQALTVGDLEAATRAQIGLGLNAVQQGRHADAIELLERAVDSGNVTPADRPDVYTALGRAYAAAGAVARAADLYERCLAQLADEAPEDVGARTRYATYLSYALSDLGDLDRAQAVIRTAIGDARQLADVYTQIRLYWALARLSAMQGKLGRALAHGRRAIALLEATEDKLQLGRAHLLCAGIANLQGNGAEASPHLEAAEELLPSGVDALDLASLRTEQARTAVRLDRAAEAIAYAEEALRLLGDADPGEQGAAHCALAEALAARGDVDAADASFRLGIDLLAGQHGRRAEAIQSCRAWAHTLRAAGRDGEAFDALERASRLAADRDKARA